MPVTVSTPLATVTLNTAPVPEPVLDSCGTFKYVPSAPGVPELYATACKPVTTTAPPSPATPSPLGSDKSCMLVIL